MGKATKQRNMTDKETTMVGTRVDGDTYTLLKRTAFSRNVSMAMIIENAILEYLQKLEGEKTNEKTQTI